MAENRLFSWSTSTSGSLKPMILSRIMSTFFKLFFWYSGIRFEMGRNYIINDENAIWWHLGRIVQTKNTRVWETQDRIGKIKHGDSSEENITWLSKIENDGEKKYMSKTYEIRTLVSGVEIIKKKKNIVVKNPRTKQRIQKFSEIVGSGKPAGSVLKKTTVVSDTIWIGVQNRHSRILLRALPRGRMRELHREAEVPKESFSGKCLDDHARSTSKELASIHSVKSGTLQNACSTRARVVANFGESAHTHIVKLMNSLEQGPKKNDDKSAVAMLKKHELHNWTGRPVVNHGPLRNPLRARKNLLIERRHPLFALIEE